MPCRLLATAVVLATCLAAPVSLLAAAPQANVVLSRPADPVEFDRVPLENVVQFIRDLSGANVFVDWRALEEAGVTRQTPVSLKLGRVNLRQLLKLSLDAAGGDELTYFIEDNIIQITTKRLANQNMITVIYPVDDLVMEVPDFEAPSIDVSANAQGTSGGGNNPFQSLDTDEDDDRKLTRQERMEQLVELITELVEPDVWAVNGGNARIRYFRDSLVITAPRYVHEKISRR